MGASNDIDGGQARQRLSDASKLKLFGSWLAQTRQLQRVAYGRDPGVLLNEERVDFVRWNTLAANVELVEMLRNVEGWKPWDSVHRGDAAGYVNREEFIDEAVDLLHFVGNLLAVVQCSDEELNVAYAAKMAKNTARQETGYAGVGADWDEEHSK